VMLMSAMSRSTGADAKAETAMVHLRARANGPACGHATPVLTFAASESKSASEYGDVHAIETQCMAAAGNVFAQIPALSEVFTFAKTAVIAPFSHSGWCGRPSHAAESAFLRIDAFQLSRSLYICLRPPG
jgi:hypothetical protein